VFNADIVSELDNWIRSETFGREISERAREVILALRSQLALMSEELVLARKEVATFRRQAGHPASGSFHQVDG